MEAVLTHVADYLWTQSWQIALLVAVVALASWTLRNRSAHVRYLLWLLVLAKCLAPPVVRVPLPVLPEQTPVAIATGAPAAPFPESMTEGPVPEGPRLAPSPPALVPESPPAVSPVREPVHLTTPQWLALGWLAGAVLFLCTAGIKTAWTIRWLHRERRTPPPEAQASLEETFRSLAVKRPPRVWLIPGVGQPFVWGLLRGAIYLPQNFVRTGGDEHSRDILAHEISHVLRFDAAVNVLQILAQAIFWFHPLVWWANQRIRREREKCCDETAIAHLGARPKDYSTAILNTLIQAQESTRPVPSLAVAGPVKNLEERIKTMLKPGKRFYKRPSLTISLMVVLAALLVVPTALVLTARAQAEAPKPLAQAMPALHEAAAAGDAKRVKSLIEKGADVNARAFRGTALHYAAENGHTEVVRLLLDRGAEVNVSRWNGETPLHLAAWSGNKQVVELLLSEGARVHAKSGYWKRTPLFYAVENFGRGSKEVIELLVAKGAKIPESHLAIYVGDMNRLTMCFKGGRDINSQESYWGTALHAAANAGRKDMVEFLLGRGARVDANDIFGITPLFYAAQRNHEDILDLLLAKGADVNVYNNGTTLVHQAVDLESKDAVRLLLGKGAKVNVKDGDGYVPLIHAIWQDKNGDQKDLVDLLISQGADVNVKDNDGHTPLYWAAMKQDSKDLIELLLAKGATPVSTIHMAARAGDLARVKRFLEEGVDVNAKDTGGETPLFAAVLADTPAVAEFLIAKGADVNAGDKWGATPLNSNRAIWGGPRYIKQEMVELLLARGADVNLRDNRRGMTPLQWQCSGPCNKAVVELLLAKGADIESKDKRGWTPLFLACYNNSSAVEVVKLLLAKGAKVNAKLDNGSTPVQAACVWGNKDVVELLIAKGAEVNGKTTNGYSALSIAEAEGHAEIVDVLRQHGAKE